MRILWGSLGAALVAVTSGLPVSAAAQSVADAERMLLPFQRGILSGLPESFWQSLAFLRREEDRQRALRADILFGLSGDEAGDKSLYKLNTGITLARGDFPSELSVVSRLGLQLRDGVLQEDVTSLLITYDYHASAALQYFAFAERFTDNFLSIQQRYEIGFGARLATHAGMVGDARTIDARVDEVRGAMAQLGTTAAAPGAQTPVPFSAPDQQRFNAAVEDLRRSLRERQARVVIGMAASVFAEIERADLEVVSIPRPGTGPIDSVKSRISLPSQQRYRLSIRPTLRWRPSRDVQVRIYPYWKLPLDAPRRVRYAGSGNRLDYRRDIFSEMTWAIRGDQTGLENVEFVLTFNHYFDNVPPALSAQVIAAELARGRVFSPVEAERSHRFTSLALRLRW